MKFSIRSLALAAYFAVFTGTVAQAAPKVVVSIKPIHSLAASLMAGVGEPELLVDGVASPHTYSLKPSDARRLEDADVIFWVGRDLEKFMEKPLETLGEKAKVVELDDAPGLLKLGTREGGTFEEHADEAHSHVPESGAHEEIDLHLWLNTNNARAMASEMTKALVAADPSNAQAYRNNLSQLNDSLDKLANDIRRIIEPVKGKPFIVFHDAYQYFEREFDINVAGSITVTPENAPGAARIKEIREKVKALHSTCVFAEPQFEPKLINVVLEGTEAKSGTLDPEAGGLQKGPALYSEMMLGIARSLKDCLG